MKEVSLKIYGSVQGVNFRYDTMRRAQALKLRGWVRNVPDGTVEVIAQGEEDDLKNLVSWAKAGPPYASVEKVDVSFRKPKEIYRDFDIRY